MLFGKIRCMFESDGKESLFLADAIKSRRLPFRWRHCATMA
jgi:hypothetical protein